MRVCNVPMLCVACALYVHRFVFVCNMCVVCNVSSGMSRGVYETICV